MQTTKILLFKHSLTLDESALTETTGNNATENDEDVEMAVVVKTEITEDMKPFEQQRSEEDDDDVIVLPTEAPTVTEILDESEILEEANESMTLADDDVMIQEPKIETQLVPDDDDESDRAQLSTPKDTSQNLIVKIKEEPKDDGYEDLVNEEDAFVEVTAIGDDVMQGISSRLVVSSNLKALNPLFFLDDTYANSPFQPAQDENAMFDDSSSLMAQSPSVVDEFVEDDNNSRPESSGPALIGGNRKLKIVLSSLAQTNLTNKNINTNSNVVDQNENSNLVSVNKFDSNSVELQTRTSNEVDIGAEKQIEYEVKPQLQGIRFDHNSTPVKRGLENSGLCSIM